MIARYEPPTRRRRPRRPGLAARVEELLGQRNLPQRSKTHLAAVREQPCVVCAERGQMQTSITEAGHMGPHGISQKACDLQAIPVCAEHHRIGPQSAHTLGRRFQCG